MLGRWLLFASLFVSACGLLSDSDDRPLAAGYTPCNDAPRATDGVICHPNQYCADQKLNWCFRGCLSDDNCSLEQLCVKNKGNDIGNCIAADELPDPDPVLEPGYTECGDSTTPDRYEICHPSQYCYSSRYGNCAAGCLSELNCTDLQICVKDAGENAGVCNAAE